MQTAAELVSSDSRSLEIFPKSTAQTPKCLVRNTFRGHNLLMFWFAADGTRNEVGLRFDNQGRLWGVEVRTSVVYYLL